ncbi:uncharacterized protein LOC123524189 [Mercenaria mercenaria]|uniref:uncharacterized protein LOC123524189 n=1 Tax=Mercenaria mercenaria TaxID=6596 RepID=UPI00234F2E46|nr:uncharacterized protein LOC123524189 [Mercenaria mercenaria]XP_045158141.2 uncharacterized protein LOC123524189 [Mercenaria mercenaria]
MTKTHVHIFILHLCVAFTFSGRFERVENRLKAIQTLLFQDIQGVIDGIDKNSQKIENLQESVDKNTLKMDSLQESVDKNTLKMDSLTELINKTLSLVTHITAPITKSKYDVEPHKKIENNQEHNSTPANLDVKRLQRAFQEHKMYSLSLQVNILTQFEKTIQDNKDAFRNISENLVNIKSQMKIELDDIRSHIDNIALVIPDERVNVAPTSLSSADCDNILVQTGEILREVNRSRYIISDRLSALKIPKGRLDTSDQTVAKCFKIENNAEKGVSNVNDHKCIDKNAKPGGKFNYHCDNKNIRLGDAFVTEVAVEGRVEVRYNNHWGTVCRSGFDHGDADLTCKLLGFARGVERTTIRGGSGQVWLSVVDCKGYETDLFDCVSPIEIGANDVAII